MTCPNCALLYQQLIEMTQRHGTYAAALSNIKFIATEAMTQSSMLGLPIDHLELTVRTGNVLRREGITTVGQLVATPLSKLTHMPGMGRKGIVEIQETLNSYRLGLQP